jgi:transcriptional regulator with XRE-family HTH domain
LRRLLSANIKAGREKLGISQEKLAEMAGLSVQMVNSIEGCRTWVSDKTLVTLASALGLEVCQLLSPGREDEKNEKDHLISNLLIKLQQNIKADIDVRFNRLIKTPASLR